MSFTSREAWRLFGIMSEFVAATERLNQIRPAVSIFGSARIKPDHPYFALAEDVARLLSDAGFSVISGGGPGIMEAANRGAFHGRSPAVGLNIDLPFEQVGNQFQDLSLNFRYFFSRKVMFVRFASAYVVLPEINYPQGGSANWSNGFLPAHYQGTPLRPVARMPLPVPASEARRANRVNVSIPLSAGTT